MKKNPGFFSFVIALALFTAPALQGAPYGPGGRATKYTQPSGETIQLRVFGDEYYARTETAAGYTVVFDQESRTYYYARPSLDGAQLLSTGVPAHKAAPEDLSKGLDLSHAAIRQARESRVTQADRDRLSRWMRRTNAKKNLDAASNGANLSQSEWQEARANAAPLNGNLIGLTLLVQFRDIKFPTDSAKMERLCNEVGYVDDGNTGSVRDYFFDQSNGQLNYTQVVPPVITLVGNKSEYDKGDAGTAGRKLITEALEILRTRGFDPSVLSVNSENLIVATNVFFAGEDSGTWAQGLWPHQWVLEQPFDLGGGISSFAYQITNQEGDKPTIGTFCHESGHLITDFPDLYDYGGESAGVGTHCLMGAGNYNNNGLTPAPINLYFKNMLGWANLTDTPADFSRRFNLPSTGNIGIRITNPNNSAEAFYIENRGPGDKWAFAAPDNGIMIWHIDDDVVGNDDEQRTQFFHYQVSLEQSDGRYDLESNQNYGDFSDLYDPLTPEFSSRTLPDSDWWSGEESGLSITVRDIPGSSIRVDVGEVITDLVTIFSPNGGEIWFHGDTRNIEWVAGIAESVEIQVLKDDVVILNVADTTLNDGIFEWTIPNTLAEGDYVMRVRSTTRQEVSDISDSPFTIKAERDLGDAVDLPTAPWTTSGDREWFAQTTVSEDGEDAAQTGPLADGESSSISTEIEGPCVLNFRWMVSSLEGVDFLSVSVPNLPDLTVPSPISGSTTWSTGALEIPEGIHTITWTFARGTAEDTSSSRTAWLDLVAIKPRFPILEVVDMFGNLQEDGNSTLGLGQAIALGDPISQTLTVRNAGDAPLRDIALTITDPNHPGYSISPSTLPDLDPGESADCQVTLTPQIGGTNQATLSITSSDESTSPYTIDLISEVTSPSLEVLDNSANTLANGQTINFGNTYLDVPVTRTIEIRNNGLAPLQNIKIGSTSSSGATVTVSPSTIASVFPSQFVKVNITVVSKSVGPHTGSITIESNDLARSPFLISLSAQGTTRPDVVLEMIKQSSSEVVVDRLNFGTQPLGVTPDPVTLRVWNRGSRQLNQIRLEKSGVHASEYELQGNLPTQLAPGAYADVKLTFAPKAAGYRFADLSLNSDDPRTPRRSVSLTGDAKLLPTSSFVITSKSGKSVALTDGVIQFGKVARNKNAKNKTFIIRNSGIRDVTDIAAKIVGTDSSDFRIVGFKTSNLGSGEEAKLTIRFDPSTLGQKSARLNIRSSDAVSPVINIALNGTGIKNVGPEIAVSTKNGKSLRKDKSVIRFQSTTKRIMRGVIINKGDLPLKKLRLSLAGRQSKYFKLLKPELKKLKPNQSTSFQVRYTGRKVNETRATLRIRSNDSNENPFDVRLRGSK